MAKPVIQPQWLPIFWKNLFLLLPFFLMGITSQAQTAVTWNGSVSSDWFNADNWDGPIFPIGPAFRAVIPDVGNDPVLSGDNILYDVLILEGAHLTIEEDVNLTLQPSMPNGGLGILLNAGTVTNHGNIAISSTSGIVQDGIHNLGTFNNEQGSTITISNSFRHGIYTSGPFAIFATTIDIESANAIGIVVEDNLFTIAGFTLGDDINSVINIDNTIGDAIQVNSNGAFSHTNDATTINIGTNTAVGEYGIDIYGNAFLRGDITIARTGSSGIRTHDGALLNNLSAIINIGTVSNAAHGIRNQGQLINEATINVHRATFSGLFNGNTGNVNHKAAGNINIGTVAATGGFGIYNVGLLNSRGPINILRATDDGINNNQGTININGGTITIGSINLGNGGIDNTGTMTNKGTLEVVACPGIGINNGTSGIFNNNSNGKLNLGITGTIIENALQNTGDFNNEGEINIQDTDGNGISNSGNSASFDNQNNGTINIGTSVGTIIGRGIRNSGGATFFNNASTITIGHGGNASGNIYRGISVEASTFQNQNGSTLSILGPFTDAAVYMESASSFFSNSGCAEMNCYDFMNISAGTVSNNNGLMFIDTDASHSNNGTFSNNGFINYVQDGLIPNVSNNDLYSIPGTFTGNTATNLFQTGGSNSYSIATNWYTDEALTIPGGTYNAGVFTATSIQAGDNTYYFSVTGNTCTFTGKIVIVSNVINPGSSTWTGLIDSDWEKPGNWSPVIVPGTDDPVIIPATPNDPVIAANVVAAVQSVNVEVGASLNIDSNGILAIDGAVSNGLLVNGTLDNNGSLSINNCSDSAVAVETTGTLNNFANLIIGSGGGINNYGIFLKGNFVNNSGGTINIDDTGSAGIFCNGSGDFTNGGGINLGQGSGAFSIGDIGIFNAGSFTNNASGVITIDNTTSDGLSTSAGIGGGFFNYGTIDIGQNSNPSAIAGFGADISGTFQNFGGTITVDATDAEGIYCTGSLTNTGVINIGQNVRTFLAGIYNEGGIYNNNCGEIRVKLTLGAPIQNESGAVFNNSGLLRIDSEEANLNAGSFTNSGVINYTSNNQIPNITNLDLLIVEGTATACTISNVIVTGGANDYTVATNWYIDEAQTTLGATYDASSNTATVILQNDSYYFEVTGNGCTFNTVAKGINNTSNSNVVTWTGIASSDWAEACNWDSGQVPTSNHQVIIPDVVNDPDIMIGTLVNVNSVEVQAGAILDIQLGASLTIVTGTSDDAIVNYGTINNVGVIRTSLCNIGLVNETSGTISNHGTISFGYVGGFYEGGLDNKGSFTNEINGTINADDYDGGGSGGYGIINSSSGDFTNQGIINIGATESIGVTGIWSFGIFLNDTNAEININRTDFSSIWNDAGTFTNKGTITVGAIASGVDADIFNDAIFNNEACGLIHIISDDFIVNVNGANSVSTNNGHIIENASADSEITTNNGVIQNRNGGDFTVGTNNGIILDSADYNNLLCLGTNPLTIGASNTLSIATTWYNDEAQTDAAGQYNQNTNTFTATDLDPAPSILYFTINDTGCSYDVELPYNASSGNNGNTVTWTGAVSTDWDEACNWDTFEVPTSDKNVIIPDVANDPDITNGITANAKTVEVQAGANLDVQSGGVLEVNGGGFSDDISLVNYGTINNEGIIGADFGTIGIANETSGSLTNYGTINIDDFYGEGFENKGVFINETTGVLNINDYKGGGSAGTAIHNLSSGDLTNKGTISLGTTADIGTRGIWNQGTFTNDTNTAIHINNTAFNSVTNSAGTFTNWGDIIVGAVDTEPNTLYYFENGAVFNNEACGLIHIIPNDPILTFSGTFTNNGHIIENTSINCSITTNNGVIQNRNGGDFTVDTNNGIIISSANYNNLLCVGTEPIVVGASNTLSIATTWYNDEAQTDVAGQYDQNANTFAATNLPTSPTVLYFTISDTGCSYEVELPVTSSGNNNNTVTWIGAVSTDWDDACNWDSYAVPNADQDVIIPDVANDPEIMDGTDALTSSIVVEEGAILDIQSGSTLFVEGNFSSYGIENRGTINNSGTIDLGLTQVAIYNRSTGTISNHGTIRPGSGGEYFTDYGIYTEGVFINEANGEIDLRNNASVVPANYGINNTGNFTNKGTITGGATASLVEIGLSNTGTFINDTDGAIHIDRTIFASLTNLSGTFTNRGNITIGAFPAGSANLDNSATFINEDCALIHIDSDGEINTLSGTFTNNGVIIENSSGNSSISTNNGIFQNKNGGSITINTNNGTVITDNMVAWTGCANNDWSDVNNWHNKTLPSFTEDVILPTSDNEVVIADGVDGFVKSIELAANQTLEIGGTASLTISGAEDIGFTCNGSLTNNGLVTIDDTGGNGIALGGVGAAENTGIIQIGHGAAISDAGIRVSSGGYFDNTPTGLLDIKSAEIGLDNSGDFINDGDLMLEINEINNTAINDEGNFANTGVLGGNAININLASNLGGTLSPGFSPGRITFSGSQSFASGATLIIEVEGTAQADHDRINVASSINLNNLALEVIVNYTPEDGDRIDFISASVISGSFSSISLPEGWVLHVGPTVYIQYSSLLPVEWLHFEAKEVDNTVELNWRTATETNNKGFEIEHSTNGSDWKYVDFVAGMGNSQQLQEYAYTHEQPAQGDNYYRLKQLDFDGRFDYSPIRLVYIESAAPKIYVYPNPATQYADLSLPPFHGTGYINLITSEGRAVFQASIQEGTTEYRLNLGLWPAGQYVISVRLGEQVFTKKLMIADR